MFFQNTGKYLKICHYGTDATIQNHLPKQNIVVFLRQVNLVPHVGRKCCCYGLNPKREGSVSPSDFDEQLSEVLVTSCLSPTSPVNDLVFFFFSAVCEVLTLLSWQDN